MSSIIASSDPPPSVAVSPATGRGVLSRASIPIDWASRRAGSMVRTTTRRPRSAARRARAAEVVVLPTPPDPQHTMIPVCGSSSMASTSRDRTPVRTCGPTRERLRLGRRWGVLIAPSPPSSCACSCQPLLAQHAGELVEGAEVDAADQLRQLVRRDLELLDQRALGVLERPPLGVVTRLGQQPEHQL